MRGCHWPREAPTGVICSAQRQADPARLKALTVGTDGGTQMVDVEVQGLTGLAPLRDVVLMLFHDELRTLVYRQQHVTTRDGRYCLRIMPYRTLENMIDRVVNILIDIAETKRLEERQRRKGGSTGE